MSRSSPEALGRTENCKLKKEGEIKPESNSSTPTPPPSPMAHALSLPTPLLCVFILGLILMSCASLRQAVILFNSLWTWRNTSQKSRKTSQVLYLTPTSKALVWLTGSGGDQCSTGTGTHYLFTGLKRCFASCATQFKSALGQVAVVKTRAYPGFWNINWPGAFVFSPWMSCFSITGLPPAFNLIYRYPFMHHGGVRYYD